VFAGSTVQVALGVVFSGLIAYAAYTDVRTRRIPNRVVVLMAVAGLGYSVLSFGVSGLLRSGSGIGVGLACWLPFYALGWLGAGDVKLFAAAGGWLGPLRTVEGALIAALAGAVLALGWMLWRYGVRRTASTLSVASVAPAILTPGGGTIDQRRTLPYGVALAVGALAAGWLPRSLLFG
jgi:prepilin peptidase CpaA